MSRVLRKPFFRLMAVVSLLMLVNVSTLEALAQTTGPANSPAQAVKLPANSPNPDKVFFADYGQFVANPLLNYWRRNGRFERFGAPISRQQVLADGSVVQYFQKVALGYFPNLVGTGWELRPFGAGRVYFQSLPQPTRDAGPFGWLQPLPNTPNRLYFPETGHTLGAGFLDLYNKTGGLFMWGYPLSEEFTLTKADGSTYVSQLFELGRMLWTPTGGASPDPTFGSEMAVNNRAEVAPEVNLPAVAGGPTIPNYNTNAWEHWVDVNLSSQSETFYEGDLPVRTNLVTTGKPGHETPTGTFYINTRIYNEHMKGGAIGTDDYYDLDNVLFTQYFTYQGHALHYAYWRSRFGVTGSHGCVNEDYASAEFAWNWLFLGARVNIHY